ncbi:head GIN domain-containing protein [Undibacterium sp. RuRC25W]|uniref:head GIN domain-containing protein n=1 Tax=Undibacterium sp. RuRC25W TaxID=3413047 RepID=UPI003BF34F67
MKKHISTKLKRISYGLVQCLTLAGIFSVGTPVFAQSQHEIVGGEARERRELSTKVVNVVMSGPMQLTIKMQPKPDIYVNGDPKLVDKVTTRIEGNTLYVGTRGIFVAVGKTQPITVELNLPSLERLQLIGSGNTLVQNLKGEKLDVDARGSGNLMLDADYAMLSLRTTGSGNMQIRLPNSETVTVYSHGSGNMILDGQTKFLQSELAGSGSMNALGLRSTQAKVRLAGSGDMTVTVNDEVKAVTTGSGNLHIHGKPARRTIQHTGSSQTIWH